MTNDPNYPPDVTESSHDGVIRRRKTRQERRESDYLPPDATKRFPPDAGVRRRVSLAAAGMRLEAIRIERLEIKRKENQAIVDRLGLNRTTNRRLSIDKIRPVIVRYFAVPVDRLESFDRTYHVVHARHIFWYIADMFSGTSISRLARHLKRDHTTVLHGIRKIEYQMSQDNIVARAARYELNEVLAEIATKSGWL